MSLSVDGVWKVGVWATTVWADGVWREGSQTTVKTGTGGIDSKTRKQIVKPTGLLARKKVILPKVIEKQVLEAEVSPKFADGFVGDIVEKPVFQMSMPEIDFEIKYLMHKQFRTQEDDVLLLMMIAATI